MPLLPHLDPFQRRAVALALYRMLTGARFDICTLRQALDVAGADLPRPSFEALRLHHCARYADLPPGFHGEIVAQTRLLVAGEPVPGALRHEADAFLEDLADAAGLDQASLPPLHGLAASPAAQA